MLTRDIALKAYQGVAIMNEPLLRLSGSTFTQEHADAIKLVLDNPSDFRDLVLQELSRFPKMELYFRPLIEARLNRNKILDSDILSSILLNKNEVEERLSRNHLKVKYFESIFSEVGLPIDGIESDEVFLDIWNELLTIDLLINDPQLGFSEIEKVVRRRDLTKIDLLATYEGQKYAIEITRLRKRDFLGTTLPNMVDAMFLKENLDDLQNALKSKLKDKDKQFLRFCKQETESFDKRLLVIKTSQWEYQDASNILLEQTKRLLENEVYEGIDEVLIVYDVINFDWIR